MITTANETAAPPEYGVGIYYDLKELGGRHRCRIGNRAATRTPW